MHSWNLKPAKKYAIASCLIDETRACKIHNQSTAGLDWIFFPPELTSEIYS